MRSGVLAAWGRAWLAGSVSIDQVVDATTAGDAPHHAVGSPGLEGLDLVPLRELLVLWRRQGGSPRLVLPAPGDVRGLPGPAGFRSAALEAGEAVVAGHLGAVPEVVEHAPSSAPSTVLWRVSATDPVPDDPIDLGEAQYELTTAIRESASTLHATETARWREEFGAGLTAARHAGECIDLPPGHPPRAVTLVAQAERLQAVLDLAATDPVGGAVDRTGVTDRAAALRPLAIAVRRARTAAYNAG